MAHAWAGHATKGANREGMTAGVRHGHASVSHATPGVDHATPCGGKATGLETHATQAAR